MENRAYYWPGDCFTNLTPDGVETDDDGDRPAFTGNTGIAGSIITLRMSAGGDGWCLPLH